MKLRLVVLVMLAFGLSGCASLSKERCLSNNWDDIGYRDGRQGYKPESLDAHTKSCAKHGVRPNRDQYTQGYKKGIATYCSTSNGRHVGERGGNYHYVCPPELEPEFLESYRYGRELYETKKKVDTATKDLIRKEGQLRAEKNASVRTSLRREILALDSLVRTLQRNYNQLLAHPPR